MKEYTYSVARVRAKEASLLTRQDIDQLLGIDGYEAALRLIRDRGYHGAAPQISDLSRGGSPLANLQAQRACNLSREDADAEEITAAARRELWDFVAELAGEDALRILRLPVDYHNIKASVKAVFSGLDGSDLLMENGTVDAELILDSVKRREYGELDPHIAQVCEEALSLLLRTQDGQACDIYVDKEMLAAMDETAKQSGDSFIRGYADIYIDTANLKAAYRCAASERGLAFIENAVYHGGTLNVRELASAAALGLDALYEHLASTRYGGCVEAMKAGAAPFEKWCGDEIMGFMDAARWDSFTAAPIVAYFYAKSTEIGAVRLILSGKRNQLEDNRIRERVPRTYV